MHHQPVEPDIPNAPIPAEPDSAPPDPDEESVNKKHTASTQKQTAPRPGGECAAHATTSSIRFTRSTLRVVGASSSVQVDAIEKNR